MSNQFLIRLLLPVVVGLILFVLQKTRKIGRIILMVMACVIFLYVGGVFAAAYAIFDVHGDVYSAIVMAFNVLCLTTVGCALWGAIKKKKVYIPIISVAVILAIVTVSVNGYYRYQDSIPTMGESDMILREYDPYAEETKVAILDEESTLKITEDFPRMDGATALYPVYSAFARAVYPEEKLKSASFGPFLDCNTTTSAYQNIVTGEADIIFVAGPDEEQVKFAEGRGVELVYTPIGREAFVFFVNSKNPLQDITVEEVQGIYSGKITEWETLGVNDLGKIRAFQRNAGSGSQSALLRLMGDIPLMEPPTEDVIDGMGGIIVQTADYKNYKNAIGYSFRFYSTEMVKNDQIKLLSIDGVAPTLENIENGTYPIASEFYAVTRKDSGENVQKLLEWILSPQGQKLIELTGYTPIK